MGKRNAPWVEIKARYLAGESPKDIGADYGLTGGQISDKAYANGWAKVKTEISESVVAAVEDDIKALCTATIKVHRKFMERMLQKDQDDKDIIQALDHAFLTDGERVNSLFQTAMNNSVKILQAHLKITEDNGEEEEIPGFNVSPDV